MRFIPEPHKIESLEIYLNMSRNKHNGNGYLEFTELIATVSKAETARRMNVTPKTIYDWMKRDGK